MAHYIHSLHRQKENNISDALRKKREDAVAWLAVCNHRHYQMSILLLLKFEKEKMSAGCLE